MSYFRYAARAAALVGLVASACGGAAVPNAAPTAAPSAAPATQAQSAAPAPKPLVIGLTESLTGSQNVESGKQSQGIRLWVADVTAAGGIKLADGTVLMPAVKSYDDQSSADRIQALYTQLINNDKADFLISPYSSGLAKAAAVVSEQNGKVMITTGAADDATMQQGFTNIYQMYTPASQYLTGAIDLALKLDPTIKTVALVYSKDAFSTSVVQAAAPYATGKGLKVVDNEGYDANTTDFGPFVDKLAALKPDAILGGGHFADGQTFAKQLHEKKVPARVLALLVAPAEPTFAQIGDASQYVVGPSQWETAVTYSAESAKAAGVPYYGLTPKQFTGEFQAKYNAPPSYHAAGGYAAGLILQKALETAGSADPAKVKAALDGIDLMTFYGHVKFSTQTKTHGMQIAHQMVFVQWQKGSDGKLATQIVWPAEAKTADAQLRK